MTTGSVWSRSRAAVASAFKLTGNLPDKSHPFGTDYSLDSSQVDVKLARSLFNNTDPRYKLGAGFARPAINVPVGFMGVPSFKVSNPKNNGDAQDWMYRLQTQWSGSVLNIHKHILLDGEVLIRLRPANRSPAYARLYSREDRDLELSYEPSEAFEILSMDEDLGAVEGVRVKHIFIVQEQGRPVQKAMYETLTADTVTLEYENNYRPKRVLPNPLGWVPAVYVANEAARHELRGRTELEPLEPYLRFYHDVMLHAGAASKLHSTAKLTIRVQDVERFLNNNFSVAEVQDGTLRFKDKDVLFFESGAPEIGVSGSTAYTEGAEIIQARAPLGDTNTLLEYIFLNIVDVSEVPEWAFGGAIASSKASVSEQSAPIVHKVNRKRHLFENSWAMVGRMALSMLGYKARVEIEWDDLATKDTKSEAEGLKARVEALIALNDAEMVSKQTVVEELRPFMPKLLPYDFDDSREERSRIADEVDEKAQQFLDEFDQQGDTLEQQDREAGLRASR